MRIFLLIAVVLFVASLAACAEPGMRENGLIQESLIRQTAPDSAKSVRPCSAGCLNACYQTRKSPDYGSNRCGREL